MTILTIRRSQELQPGRRAEPNTGDPTVAPRTCADPDCDEPIVGSRKAPERSTCYDARLPQAHYQLGDASGDYRRAEALRQAALRIRRIRAPSLPGQIIEAGRQTTG